MSQKKTVTINAVSWRNRRVKVADQWANVGNDINLKAFEVGKEHEIELEQNLDGNWVIMKLLKSPRVLNG